MLLLPYSTLGTTKYTTQRCMQNTAILQNELKLEKQSDYFASVFLMTLLLNYIPTTSIFCSFYTLIIFISNFKV